MEDLNVLADTQNMKKGF